MAALLLLSCGCSPAENKTGVDSTEEPTTDTSTEAEEMTTADSSLLLAENGEGLYTIVREEDGSESVIKAAQSIQSELSAALGGRQPISTDWVKRGDDPDAVSEYEILIGNTNRKASADAASRLADTRGWYVGVIGKRVVILASRQAYYPAAVEFFLSCCEINQGRIKMINTTEHIEAVNFAFDNVNLTLRVGSYNIRHGADVGLDMNIIAADILEKNLDVVGLQEIDQKTTRVNGLDTMKALSEATGYKYYGFARAIDFKGGEYGTAILSRYPIESFETTKLYSADKEARSIGHAVINVDGVLIDFFNTHLSYESTSLRGTQFVEVAKMLSDCDSFILTGDFNTSDTSEFGVIAGSTLVNPAKYITFPSSGGYIDNIVISDVWKTVDAGTGPVGHSDHNLLWAELKIGE